MLEIGGQPAVSEAHLAVARNYSSPLLLGPPVCDELVALVQHMFTEEEADVVRHLRPWHFVTASTVARRSGRPLQEVEVILSRVAHDRHLILSFGSGDKERFGILPVVPGTFEMTMMRPDPDTVTEWHRRFAVLFEALFATGYDRQYLRRPAHYVRYLPVGEVIETLPQALPSDRLEVILDRYEHFGIAACQCRLCMELAGEGCGRMLETCTIVGEYVPAMIQRGFLKSVSKDDVIEIKAAAEREGLVTWMVNEESGKYTSGLCSCCGCCCNALRTVTQLNAPGLIAPPHFVPDIDRDQCTLCGRCVKACPMDALVISGEGEDGILVRRAERCIGCGLCSVACEVGALTMGEAPDYRHPPGGWTSFAARYFRSHVSSLFRVWRSRRA